MLNQKSSIKVSRGAWLPSTYKWTPVPTDICYSRLCKQNSCVRSPSWLIKAQVNDLARLVWYRRTQRWLFKLNLGQRECKNKQGLTLDLRCWCAATAVVCLCQGWVEETYLKDMFAIDARSLDITYETARRMEMPLTRLTMVKESQKSSGTNTSV